MKSWVAKISLVIAYTFFYDCWQIYLAHIHLSLCQKVLPLIPQYCWKIKLISLATNYHMYYMIKWYADTFSVFQFTICSSSRKGCLFWVCQPWYNWLILGIINKKELKKKKLIVTMQVWCETLYFKATEFIVL